MTVDFARGSRIPLKRLRETAADRWDLTAAPGIEISKKGWLSAADVLEMRQGVTPGGCLDLFLMSDERATQLGLESELVHRAIKSKETGRWRVAWFGRVLFYPYRPVASSVVPAFALEFETVENGALAEALRRFGVRDGLDFSKQIDRREEDIVRRRGVSRTTVGDLLRHRIALGLVKYPNAAAYLIQHFERLEGRVFEKKRFVHMGKQWYEYHRPRDPEFMFSKKRIISPTLMKQMRFSLDSVGFLSDHACLYLQPTPKTHRGYSAIREGLAKVLARRASLEDVLKYCLAFLNSEYAQQRLVAGHRPTPRGFYAVTEEFLREIPIPPPTKRTAQRILELVTQVIAAKDDDETQRLERDLAKIINAILTV